MAESTVQRLIENGANISLKKMRKTVFFLYIRLVIAGITTLIRFDLYCKGANVNVYVSTGFSSFAIASQYGYEGTV